MDEELRVFVDRLEEFGLMSRKNGEMAGQMLLDAARELRRLSDGAVQADSGEVPRDGEKRSEMVTRVFGIKLVPWQVAALDG